MFYKFIILFLFTLSLFSKNFTIQKPVMFLTKPLKSKYEMPVNVENLIKINRNNGDFLDNLDYKVRKKLVKYALKFNNTKGKRSRNFRNDCSGFTRRVYAGFNIELFRLPRHELRSVNGKWLNGVELIWKYCKKHGKVFIRKAPKAGDIVFFDNTHDRNKNRKYDDYFTHVGIVVKVDSDKTIHYIHKATSGIKISKLNMVYENKRRNGKKEVNSYLRRSGKYRLSGQLVRGFGSIFSPERTRKSTKPKPKVSGKAKENKDTRYADKSVHHHSSAEETHSNSFQEKKDKEKYPYKSEETYKHINAIPIQVISQKYRDEIVKRAVSYIGKNIKKESFARRVYADLGFNILDNEFNDEEHIERAVFWTFKKNGRLFSATKPKRGDLIFFDKLNGNKLFLNIAIIEKVDGNQITFIHSFDGVVERGHLNNKYWKINRKGSKTINSYLLKDRASKRKLASDFFRRFGSIFSK